MHWARAYFPYGSSCKSVDNNLCESFNNAIIESRFYPIISQQEMIRKKMYVIIQEQRSKCDKWHGIVCPNILRNYRETSRELSSVRCFGMGKMDLR